MAPNWVIEEELVVLPDARCKPNLSQKLREAADLIFLHGTERVKFLSKFFQFRVLFGEDSALDLVNKGF
jgi:hypothetical protein